MNGILAAAVQVDQLLQGAGVRYCVIGVIVLKAFAGRDQDWIDIDNIVARRAGFLDRPLILQETRPLLELKEDPHAWSRLTQLLAAF